MAHQKGYEDTEDNTNVTTQQLRTEEETREQGHNRNKQTENNKKQQKHRKRNMGRHPQRKTKEHNKNHAAKHWVNHADGERETQTPTPMRILRRL